MERKELPRPDVSVTNNEAGETHVVISRDNKGKSYRVDGVGINDKIKDVVEKVIGDGYTAEWLP